MSDIWSLLSTRSRRAVLKSTKKRGFRGNTYRSYLPRGQLLERLEQETKLTAIEIMDEIERIRREKLGL